MFNSHWNDNVIKVNIQNLSSWYNINMIKNVNTSNICLCMDEMLILAETATFLKLLRTSTSAITS